MLIKYFAISIVCCLTIVASARADVIEGTLAYHFGNYEKALNIFKLKENEDNPAALDYLGRMYEYGQGVEKNLVTAKQYYELAINNNSVPALNHLADMLIRGRGTEKNIVRAYQLIEQAALRDDLEAQFNMGRANALEIEIPRNIPTAVKWFSLAAQNNLIEKNNFAAQAQFALGQLYFNGVGMQKDNVQAYMWYIVSAKRGLKNAALISNDLKLILTPEEIERGQSLADDFLRDHFRM